ncbi:DLGAP1 family protein [Megaselia abdita]
MHRHEITTDGSVDSIGTCSLDVNAETADFSDTSSSLNFVAEEERYNRQGAINRQKIDDNFIDYNNSFRIPSSAVTPTTNGAKLTTNYTPSYLNLACCVNGYSNLTTYDSIFRKNLNKSPTPIAIPTTKEPARSNFLTKMENNHHNHQSLDVVDKSSMTTTKYDLITKITANTTSKVETKSFVQQRVERLYGADALAQGILSPRPVKTFNTQIHTNGVTRQTEADENSFDLPVFRHLRPEFRAQLPVSVSPKKEVNKTQSSPLLLINNNSNNTTNNNLKQPPIQCDLLVEKVVTNGGSTMIPIQSKTNGSSETSETLSQPPPPSEKSVVKDGNHFLQLVEAEQTRLLNLAKNIENELDDLLAKGEVSEEVSGQLRSASGKARLLVNQKLKQFKGLCHNNLNGSPEEKFHTTNGDLQGFWDMVYLQVEHVDSLYKEIQDLKANNWVLPNQMKEPQFSVSSSAKKPSLLKTPNPKSAPKPQTPAQLAAAQRREQQRKDLMEMKRKHKLAMQNKQETENES